MKLEEEPVNNVLQPSSPPRSNSKDDVIDVQVQSYSSSDRGTTKKQDDTRLEEQRKLEEEFRRRAQQQQEQEAMKKKTEEQLAYEEKRRRLSEQLRLQEEKARIDEERKRLEVERQLRMEEEKQQQLLAAQRAQFQAIADKLGKADDAYEPTKAVLENTQLLMQEVTGPIIPAGYKGKEAYFTGRNSVVYSGRSENVPIHVSTPGTMIEFTIDKKGYDFGFEIVAFMEEKSGTPVKIKEYAPFTKHSQNQNRYEDTILVGSGSVPCMLQFRFDNKYQTLLEKVIVSYRIKVTTPPKELIMRGRRKRGDTSMKLIEKDLNSQKESLAKVDGQIEYLEEEINKIKSSMMKRSNLLKSLREEEKRWATVLQKMKHKQEHAKQQEPAVRKRKPTETDGASPAASGSRPVRPVRPVGMKRKRPPPSEGAVSGAPRKKKSSSDDGDNNNNPKKGII